jgi:hypothetical protein
MFGGTVTFRARIKGNNGLTVPLFSFNPSEPGIEKVEIEGPTGYEIVSTVHLAAVATREEGVAIATKANTTALNRISFFHNIAIEDAQVTGSAFSLLNPPPGHLTLDTGDVLTIGETLRMVHGISAQALRADLERTSPPGEKRFGLFRLARQSVSPVEEFVTLYNILQMLTSADDDQADVDTFIRREEPTVLQTPSPHKPKIMETVYTRLRNELGHTRAGVNLDETKKEMADHLGGLIALTKRAIELGP